MSEDSQVAESSGPTWRPVRADDVDFMIELFLALTHQREPGSEPDVEAIASGTRAATIEQAQGKLENSVTYVIERGGAPVGRLRVVRTGRDLEIAGLQIHPRYQSRGVGSAVISALMQEAQTRLVPTTLGVDKDNPDARRLYLRLGFRDTAEFETEYRMAAGPRATH